MQKPTLVYDRAKAELPPDYYGDYENYYEKDDDDTDSSTALKSYRPKIFIFNKEIHVYRRTFWFFVFILGLSYSGNMIVRNAHRYYQYPSMIKPVNPIHAEFPKVTICLNSMHSKKALDQFYPGLIDILPLYYGQADKNNEKYKNVSWTDLNHLDLMKVMKDTTSTYWVQACMYQKRNCIDQWNMTLTMYGYCLQLKPERRDLSADTDNLSDGGRTASLSIVFAFNKSDWASIGWANYLEGFTLYYSALDDDALEPAKSILLTDVTRGVPIVSLRQKCIKRLGYPYSECRHSDYSMLHYKNYTRNQCLFECLMERVHLECDCSAPYFPVEWKSQKRTKKICTFSNHSDCVAPILENFNYGGCSCPPKCEQLETHHEAVQYGQYYAKENWREQTKDNPMVMTSMMLYLKRMTDMDKEVAEYSQTQLFSDIGGAAGLMLGMSFATFVGILDWLFSFTVNLFFARYQRIKKLGRHISQRKRKNALQPTFEGPGSEKTSE